MLPVGWIVGVVPYFQGTHALHPFHCHLSTLQYNSTTCSQTHKKGWPRYSMSHLHQGTLAMALGSGGLVVKSEARSRPPVVTSSYHSTVYSPTGDHRRDHHVLPQRGGA